MLLLSIGVPLGVLVVLLGKPAALFKAAADGCHQLLTSLLLSALSATLMTIYAILAAYVCWRTRGIKQHLLMLIYFLPLAVPGTVLGIGIVRLCNQAPLTWILDSPLVVAVAMCGLFSPFAVYCTRTAFARIPPDFEAAAALAGMGVPKRLFMIILPLILPGVVAGWGLTFALSLGEVSASLLVLPPTIETLPVRIYNLTHYDATDVVAALCLIQAAVVGFSFAVAGVVMRWRRRGGKRCSH
jgi:ABC-type Fe3+ transport system permease subunit